MTMSCSLDGVTGDEAMLRNYTKHSRNLWKSSMAAGQQVCHGADAIEARWLSFGRTEHDYGSFTIDVVHYTPAVAVFTVGGLFRECSAILQQDDRVFGFVRTFVLRRIATGLGLFGHSSQHVIGNEQVLVYRPSATKLAEAFVARPALEAAKMARSLPLDGGPPLSAEEMDVMVNMFQEITNLMPTWCKK